MQSNLIPLESIQIATPCRADWHSMQRVSGCDGIRFCPSCSKNVYNLSAMTREEAVRHIREQWGDMCVRLYRRSDGTVITNDCPVGRAAYQRRQMAPLLAKIVGTVAALLGMGYVFAHNSNEVPAYSPPTSEIPEGATMGAISAVPPFPVSQGQSQPLFSQTN